MYKRQGKVWVVIETEDGLQKRVLAALDTQSNATFMSRYIGTERAYSKRETNRVKGLGGTVATKAAKVTLITDTERVEMWGRFEPWGSFNDPDTHLLLGASDCRELGIDVNYAVDNLIHLPVRYRKTGRKRSQQQLSGDGPMRRSKHLEHL